MLNVRNLLIFRMCADKPNQYVAHRELYQHHQPIVIALDVENIPSVADTIHTVECPLDVCKALPFCFLGLFVPVLKRSL